MMIRITKPYFHATVLTLLAAALPVTLQAQTLSKDITVDHEIVPEIREAVMPWSAPVLTLPQITRDKLDPAYNGVGVKISPTRSLLPPIATGSLFDARKTRGYVAAGYFPTYNLGVSAGYRLVDKSATSLDAFLQFDGRNYKSYTPFIAIGNDMKWHNSRNTLDLGLNLNHTLTPGKQWLNATLLFTHDRFSELSRTKEDYLSLATHNRHTNRLMANISWERQDGEISAHAGATFDLFDQSTPHLIDYYRAIEPIAPEANRQIRYAVEGSAAKVMSGSTKAGLDASFSLLTNTRNHTTGSTLNSLIPSMDLSLLQFQLLTYPGEKAANNYTTGLFTLRPYYTVSSGRLDLTVGARVDFTFNSGKFFHIAPDVNLGWRPADMLSIGVRFGGGEWQNTLVNTTAINYLAVQWLSYRNSHIPITGGATLTVGPLKGVALELTADFARANDWLMPTMSDISSLFVPVNMRGWKFGAALTYNGGNVMRARASYEFTPGNSLEHGWWMWADRSRRRVSAELAFTPIKPLEIDLSWSLSTGRKIGDNYSLRAASSLDLGARWSFTKRLSVFLRGENLLNRSYFTVASLPAQKIHGLVGVTYKF